MAPMAGLAPALAAIAVALALSCSESRDEEKGDLEVLVSVRSELSIPVGVTWIHLYGTSAAGVPVDLWAKTTVTSSGSQASFLGVFVGSYLVEGAAYSDARALKRASDPDFVTLAPVPVTVTSKSRPTLTLVLQQNADVHPPATVVNVAPAILSILASAAELDPTDPGAALELAASATDADDAAGSLAVAWSDQYAPAIPAGAARGTFSAPTALATRYSPPPTYEGTVTLKLEVTDPLGAASAQALAVAVTPRAAKGDVLVVAQVNNHPDLTALTTAQGEVPPLGSTSFAVTASDADRDALRYAWSDGGCGGSFGTPAAAATTWVAPALPRACVVSVTVTDWTNAVAPAVPVARGGATTGRLTVQVMTPATVVAPHLVYATQAPASPVPGGVPASPVRFRVAVVETTASGGSVPVTALAWSDGLGGTFTPVAGTADYVEWTPPACAAPGTHAYTVTVTATGSPPADDGSAPERAFPFPVTVLCP